MNNYLIFVAERMKNWYLLDHFLIFNLLFDFIKLLCCIIELLSGIIATHIENCQVLS